MTLTYIGPTIGDGDLIVPAAQGAALDPLLAEAVLLLRASSFIGSDGDDWPNEGTGGAALNAVPTPPDDDGPTISPAFFGPDDGLPTLRYFTGETNEGDGANSSQLVTPHTEAMEFADGWFMCVQSKSIRDAESHGAVQSVRVRACVDDDEFVGNDLCVNVDTGQIRVTAPTGGPQDLGTPGVVDAYEVTEIAGSIIAATGLYRAYVRDDADPDVTVGGRGWRIVGETTEGAVVLDEGTGPLIVGIGKGWYGYAEVYEFDGTDATLVAEFDPADADGWEGPTDTVTSSGTVWTLGATSAIVDATVAGFQGGPAPSMFTVPDDALLDFLGTDDFTVAAWAAFSQVSPGTFHAILGKGDGSVGSGGTGWLLTDSSFTGGALAVAEEGAGPVGSVGGAVTQGVHLLVIRREGDVWTLFVDGTGGAPGDLDGMDLAASAAMQLLVGPARAGLVFPLWDRALTDTEITVDLPAAIGA